MSVTGSHDLLIFPDSDTLARDAARRVRDFARAAAGERGRFTIALAGGSTPEKTYQLLAQAEFDHEIPWEAVLVFFGDERFVPHADAERSNYHLARRTLLSAVGIGSDHVFPIDTSLPSPEDAARAYEATLRAVLGDSSGAVPVFDLILLGLGDDGHTASLFPRAAALHQMDALAVASPPGILPPPVDRITLTFPVLNAARNVLFLIAGSNKAEALRDILENDPSVEERPAKGVSPANGTLTYLVDEAAAALLTPTTREKALKKGPSKEKTDD